MDQPALLAPRNPGIFKTLLLLALALVPSLVFAALALTGALNPLGAVASWSVCSVVAVIFILLLRRDIAMMITWLHTLRTMPHARPLPPRLLTPGLRALESETQFLIQSERQLQNRNQADKAEDRTLMERLPDPLLKLDPTGQIIWHNDRAVTDFGNEMAALMRHPDLRAALATAFAGDLPVRRELLLSTPVSRYLEVTLIPVGKQIYMLVSDRTRERALEKMRADFVANASHELRTPLASLIGFIETLQGPAADDKEAQLQFLSIMAEQAARMQRLIGDLLSLSKIEISEHSPPTEKLSLPTLLARIAAAMAPVMDAQGSTLTLNVPADLPEILADSDQLTQVFTNLLDNALKYGKPGGKIQLTASAAFDSRFPPNGVAISVQDEGGGIAREHIPRLTERFYRIDKGRSRKVGGTGLGLAIVKHVVNRHRGYLAIESEPGQGTIFTIWLPGPRN